MLLWCGELLHQSQTGYDGETQFSSKKMEEWKECNLVQKSLGNWPTES
jgi:hypothetical protein